MADTQKMFDIAKIRTVELLRQTVDYLSEKYAQSRRLFTVSSPFGQVIFVLQNIANLIFYYIEDSISELQIRTASRRNSVIGLAGLAGYEPSRAIASTGSVEFKVRQGLPAVSVGSVVAIANYTRLTCRNNNLEYVLMMPSDDMRVQLSDSSVAPPVMIKQGRVESQQFTGKNADYETFGVRFKQPSLIDHFFVNLYVNDVKWQKYESLRHMPRGANGYMVRTSPTGIDVFTGTDNMGSKVPLGATVRVEYLVTEGIAGKITGQDPSQVVFEFSDTGFDQSGMEIDLNEVLRVSTIVVPEYGSNPEPIDLTRMLLSKTLPTLLTLSSYELLLRRTQAFSIVRTYPDPSDGRMACIFLVPDIAKILRKNETYFSVPEERFYLSATAKEQLYKYVALVGTQVIGSDYKIVDPVISRYVINVSIITYDGYSADAVKNDIYIALSNYFLTINRTSRIPRSDLIRIIEGVDGVDSVNVFIISEKNEASKMLNSSAADICVDEFNDIIMADGELPIVRGGWHDRNGNYYDKGISKDGLGAVNVQIRSVTYDKAMTAEANAAAQKQKFNVTSNG